ncbi:MAG: hypothetical protein FJ245_15425 [Nitrospira sp.]|nr:hypothetical protein [Nitrospira sp.]
MALLTTEQAYRALGYPTAEALAKAATRGTIPAQKHGRRWKFDLDLIARRQEWDADRGRVAGALPAYMDPGTRLYEILVCTPCACPIRCLPFL